MRLPKTVTDKKTKKRIKKTGETKGGMDKDFQEIKDLCLKTFSVGERVAVGVSGGADSMVLLHFLKTNEQFFGIELVCINVNHGIRGEEGNWDSDFVRDYCKKNKIRFVGKKINVPAHVKTTGESVEEAARNLRYKAFEDIMQKLNISKICLAHHLNDQAESVLMHIFRGSGLRGATGMQFVANNGRITIVRPLIYTSKKEILKYAKANKVEFVEDSSNKSLEYARNYIRAKVIPIIEKNYTNVVEGIANFSRNAREDEDFIESSLPGGYLLKTDKGVFLKLSALSLPYSLRTRLIRKAFFIVGAEADIEQKHINIVSEMEKLKSGSRLSMPWDVTVYKDYDNIAFVRGKIDENKTERLFNFGNFNFKGFGDIVITKNEEEVVFGSNRHYVDFLKIPVTATWRTKRQGDIFAKLGSGSKKLVDYFTDKKIPQRQRGLIPLLAVKNEVLIVAGEDISEKVKIDDQTQQIIRLDYFKK